MTLKNVQNVQQIRNGVDEPTSSVIFSLARSTYYVLIFTLLLIGRWQPKEFIYMQF
jgi:hypothetical protein